MATVDTALAKKGLTTKAVETWKADMPREEEMVPKDKYTMFDRKEKTYRKGVHSKWSCLDHEVPSHASKKDPCNVWTREEA